GKTHTNADALSRWPLPIDDVRIQAQQLQHVSDETEPKFVINLIDTNQDEPEPQQLEISPVEQDNDQANKMQQTSTMAQHDVMISGITNESRAYEFLRELIEHQLDDTVEVEWLNVHRSPSSLHQRQQTEWTDDLTEASKICDELNRAKEGLEQERVNLVARNQTVETENKRLELEVTEDREKIDTKDRQLETTQLEIQQLRTRVERLEEENAELRGQAEQEEPLNCPVCLEVYTSERTILLSHVVQPVSSATDRARQ
ncbi:hypothetical protein BpHYR1_018915, partial [Brachionus plicatilis]